jgi:hypothetical protein
LDSISQSAYNAFSSFTEPTFQFIEKSTEDIKPAEIAAAFYDFLNQLSAPPDEELTPEEAATVKTEAAVHEIKSQQQDDHVEVADEKQEPENTLQNHEQKRRDDDYHYYVELMGMISSEEWDSLVEKDLDPAEIVQTRRSAAITLKGINQFIGEQAINELAKTMNVDLEHVETFRNELLAMGATPEQAQELALATQTLRALSSLAADNTVSSDGLLDGIFRFADKWIVRSMALKLVCDKTPAELANLSEAQWDLLNHVDKTALSNAIFNGNDPEYDALYQAVLSEIQRREQ